MKLLIASALLIAFGSEPAVAKTRATFVSQYTQLNQCKSVERAPLGEDWVYFRCKGLGDIPVWYVCTDSARCKYGFGAKANASGTFGTGEKGSWRIEWRGPRRSGPFKPVAVILRLTSPDGDEPNRLYVYRLRPDGTSCIVGKATTNTAARLIADNAARGYRCEMQPELL